MKQITMREFAALCRSDPDLNAQTLAIPKTITPEKLFALAAHNGYCIVPERTNHPEDRIEPLEEDMLDRVSGGTGPWTQEAQLDALHTWIYYVMGFGDKQPNQFL